MSKMDEYKKAEALGKIKTTTEALEAIVPETEDEDTNKVFDNPSEFELAVGRAKLDGSGGPLFVSSTLMKYLLKGRADKSVMYQGVRCYLQDSKEDMDRIENMSAENRHTYEMKELNRQNGGR